ncbi:MAG: peroxiredoxin [Bacteroidetes bacterium]|nr:MAG: peroxiredoxin [Bacteroidota bacterium]
MQTKKYILISVALIMLSCSIYAQRERDQRIPLIGTQAPGFKAPSTNGPVSFPDDFGNDWKILFAHPRDFTPVCSSEILELAYRQDEFKALGAHILIISVDRMASHKSWKADLESIAYKGRNPVKIAFPFVVDSAAVISQRYGMIDSRTGSGQSIRGVFFIDPQNEIRAFHFYPNEVGRNTDEIIRTLKALQTQQSYDNIVIPANWQPGDDVMIPILSKEDKEELQSPESKIHYINWYMIYRKQE